MARPAAPLGPLAALLLAAACARGGDDAAASAAAAAADLSDPRRLVALDAGEAARRLGSLEWSGTASFTVTRQGDSSARVHVVERHRVRQLASGDFEVEAEVDAGQGPGAVTGKHVIWTGGLAYARGRFAPWRERPTDRGRDARRFRDESFGLIADLVRLYGPSLSVAPAGEASHLGRRARRFALSLAPAVQAAAPPPDGRVFGAGGPDEETRRHLAFLDGRVPAAASGEILLDAATGVPLRARLAGAFGVKDDPRVRVQVDLSAEVRAYGDLVGSVAPPRKALPDARKPAGVAQALELAGLKARAKGEAGAEPADEPDVP
jgi:hypothetical protein